MAVQQILGKLGQWSIKLRKDAPPGLVAALEWFGHVAVIPGRMDPVGPEDLAPLFPMELILQEVSTDRYIDIPGGVLDVYRQWRPSPLFRAHRLEKALGTPARIYYKYEGTSPAGSHKPNTAVPQAFYNAKAGVQRLTTETGAGQWGTALAFASAQYGIDCPFQIYEDESSGSI